MSTPVQCSRWGGEWRRASKLSQGVGASGCINNPQQAFRGGAGQPHPRVIIDMTGSRDRARRGGESTWQLVRPEAPPPNFAPSPSQHTPDSRNPPRADLEANDTDFPELTRVDQHEHARVLDRLGFTDVVTAGRPEHL